MYLRDILSLPSSLKWCENKYMISPFIAEFWNTITGLVLCLSSFLFYKNNKKLTGNNNFDKSLNSYLFQANKTLFIVGIGTMFFHGTLLYIFQLFDEIPMLLMTFDYMYILLTITNSNYLYVYYTKYFLSFIIIVSYLIHPTLQIITFFTFFTTNVCFIILLLDKIPSKYKSSSTITKSYYLLITGIFVLLIWVADSLFCKYVQHFYLHSVWHIVTSILIYMFNDLLKIYISEFNFNKIA
jgi:hypothetical protein